MAADKARITHHAPRKYREVVSQQGRVLLEADLNEETRLGSERARKHALDFVGPCGTPDGGFKLAGSAPGSGDFIIGPGTMYVGGLRVTQQDDVAYSKQTEWLDREEAEPWGEDLWREPQALMEGTHHAMLVLREQEVTAVEDPALRDVALGGPDSAARSRLVQRVVAARSDGDTCEKAAATSAGFWSEHGLVHEPEKARLRSRARLQVTLVTAPPSPSPCDPPAASGYLGADNQLIRVQVAGVGGRFGTGEGLLVWGYHNGSILYRCRVLDQQTVELESRPVSPEHQPRAGQVVQMLQRAAEIGDDAYVAALTGPVMKLTTPYDPETGRIALPEALPADYPKLQHVYLRLWEDMAEFEVGDAVALAGTGLEVTITRDSAGPLHLGDWWSVAARPLTPNAVYPERYLEEPQPPDGPRMWVCALAVLEARGRFVEVVDDCRLPFDNLVELTARSGGSCCCVTVKPAEGLDLQQVIDSAAAEAAGASVTVHLESGEYKLGKPLRIEARHKGLTIGACTGGNVILSAGNPQHEQFGEGLMRVEQGAELKLEGLMFKLAATPLNEAMKKRLEELMKADPSALDRVPKGTSVGLSVEACAMVEVEDCLFLFEEKEEGVFGAAMLFQGENGEVRLKGCRVIGNAAGLQSTLHGVLAGHEAMAAAGKVTFGVLRITECVFGFLETAMLIFGRPAHGWVTNNVTRGVRGSFYMVARGASGGLVDRPPGLTTGAPAGSAGTGGATTGGSTGGVSTTPVSTAPTGGVTLGTVRGVGLLTPLLRVGEGTRITPRTTDTAAGSGSGGASAAARAVGLNRDALLERVSGANIFATPAAAAVALQPGGFSLTLHGNQFDGRPVRAGNEESEIGVAIMDAEAAAGITTISGNTIWNRSSKGPTLVVWGADGFAITGNVLVNDFPRGPNQPRRPALLVLPGPTQEDERKVPIKMMTVTGNVVFGGWNLKDLRREEWKRLEEMSTWEFFNTQVE